MINVLSLSDKKFLLPIDKKEKDLQKLLVENWSIIFPHLLFIKEEFELKGKVRSKDDKSGRIDILAFNRENARFVVIELKRDYSRSIIGQASDYQEFVEDNFDSIYLQCREKFDADIPKSGDMDKDNTQLILVAKSFSEVDIKKANEGKSKDKITLIKYEWFKKVSTEIDLSHNNFFIFEYLSNYPSSLYRTNNYNMQPNDIISEEELHSFVISLNNRLRDKITNHIDKIRGDFFSTISQINDYESKIRNITSRLTEGIDEIYNTRIANEIKKVILQIDKQVNSMQYPVHYINKSKEEIEDFIDGWNDKRDNYNELISFLSSFNEVFIEAKFNESKNLVKIQVSEYNFYVYFHKKAKYDVLFVDGTFLDKLSGQSKIEIFYGIVDLPQLIQKSIVNSGINLGYGCINYRYSCKEKKDETSYYLHWYYESLLNFFRAFTEVFPSSR